MKRYLSIFLVLLMLAAVFAGCSGSTESAVKTNENASALDDISYVMIYNPKVFDEHASYDASSLSTGSIGDQVDTAAVRADLPAIDPDRPVSIAQNELGVLIPDTVPSINVERADGLAPLYDAGDYHEFFFNMSPRYVADFECLYEGESCYVWTCENFISEADAARFGEEFDNTIYPLDTETFGVGRFTDNGGKVHILFYPITSDGCGTTLGYFCAAELLSSEELPDAAESGLNVDHAIININSDLVNTPNDSLIYATLTHEYQHLINCSNSIRGGHTLFNEMMNTWLNEAMSGYAEDIYIPGCEDESRADDLYTSDQFRKGMSLYNFTCDGDLGPYGAVISYAIYLADEAGSDIFSKIQSAWSRYGGPRTVAEALNEAAPDSFRKTINDSVTYPASLEAELGDADSFMSKLTMNFWLASTKADILTVSADQAEKYQKNQLYGGVNPVSIEGGGRIIFKPLNGKFEIPEDADKGLVYIGLDENFNLTGIVTTSAEG